MQRQSFPMVPRFLKIAGMFVLLAVQIQGATLLQLPNDEDQMIT